MSRLVFTIIIPVQSYDHSVALSVVLSIVLGNHFTIGLLLIISQYLSIYLSTGQNFTHGYFDNKRSTNCYRMIPIVSEINCGQTGGEEGGIKLSIDFFYHSIISIIK